MTERQQLREVCGWNRQLARENSCLRAELHRKRSANEALETTNAKLAAEAAECFLTSARTEARCARR
jgi:hypothetical protein